MTDLPDLKVRHKKVEGYARFDLRRFLYVPPKTRSGCVLGARWFLDRVDREGIEPEKMERLSLLVELKEYFEYKLTMGASLQSQKSHLSTLQAFFNFFDQQGKIVTLGTLIDSYLEYSEYLFQRCLVSRSKCNTFGELV